MRTLALEDEVRHVESGQMQRGAVHQAPERWHGRVPL